MKSLSRNTHHPASPSEVTVFAVPGLTLLVVFDYFKPQEYIPALAGFPLLYALTALTVAGFVVDLRLGLSRLRPSPQLALALAFTAWSLLATLPRGGAVLAARALTILVPFSLYLLIAHTVQSFRALQWFAALLLAVGLGLGAVATHQGFAGWGCHRVTYVGGAKDGVYDGRTCSGKDDVVCRGDGADPGTEYVCERVGLLGTHTIGGRVRFMGTLEDPNELALAIGITLPLAFGFLDRRRSPARLLLLVTTLGVAGLAAVLTRSRGGQVVFLLVLAVYFVARLGAKGLVVGLIIAAPIVLLGGREGGEASTSTLERLECWAQGMRMLRESPLVGVGLGQFTEHHYLTAHNSYVLTAAELGLPGLFLWSALLYVSVKIPLQALLGGRLGVGQPGLAPVASSWSLAILATFAGLLGGMLFLSFAYKEVLWIFIGLSGALYQAIARHAPSFRIAFRRRDVAVVVAMTVALLLVTAGYTRLKLGY